MLYLRVALPFNFAFVHVITPARNLFVLYEQMGVADEPERKKEIINYLSVGNGIVIANAYANKLFKTYTA